MHVFPPSLLFLLHPSSLFFSLPLSPSPSFLTSFLSKCWDRSLNHGSPPWEVSKGNGVSDGEPGGLGGSLRLEWLGAEDAGGESQAVRRVGPELGPPGLVG